MNTVKARVVHEGNTSRWVGTDKNGRHIRLMRGTVVDVTPDELAALSGFVVPVDTAKAPPAAAVEEEDVDAEEVADLLEENAANVANLVSTEKNVPFLRAALAAEKSKDGKNRTTVVKAIEARLAELG